MGYADKTKAELIAELEALRAALRTGSAPGEPGRSPGQDLDRLLEDLRLHQIELEMQNRELRETQAALEASRDRYADLYDFAPVGYASVDHKGRVLEINLAGATLLGVERSKIVGSPLLRYVAKDDAMAFLGHLRLCRAGGCPEGVEVRLARGGPAAWVRIEGTPPPAGSADEGGCRLAITDVTARKEAEAERAWLLERAEEARAEAEAANREKDEFLAMVSHELRTPLNAMLGWAQLLLAGGLDAAAASRGLEAIARNARAQERLIDDLLDVARIISGKVSVELRPTDFRAVVGAVFEEMSAAAHAKGVALALVRGGERALVSGDPERLQQVVGNLVSNAIKFTPADGRVEAEMCSGGGAVTLTVRDTGEGIEPSVLPHIFDRFRQADMSTRRKHGGIGLGLAIARHLVEAHNGTVHAASEGRGRGATFVLSLPLLGDGEVRREAPEAAAGGAPSPGRILEGLRVLVVEDMEDAQTVFALLLDRGGARATTVGSAREAIAAIGRELPDVLVSDIGMPGEDGYDLIRAVRALEPERGGNIPAIALTAYAGRADRAKALEAGFQAHVRKPVAAAELISIVARVAGRTGGTAGDEPSVN